MQQNKTKQYDIAIIGAGPAGYFSAIKLLEKNPQINIVLFEKCAKPLQKFLITGNGSCNFTHSGTIDEFLRKYGNNGRFLQNGFYNYFNEDFVEFLESNGIKTICREDGKYFPKSMKANEIRDLFIEKTKTITTKLETSVTNVSKSRNTFKIQTNNKDFFVENILITTGGKSVPSTGSTGDGYEFAKSLGHTIIQPKQSLASIYSKNFELADCSGISFENVSLKIGKKQYNGPLLITHKGLSGPLIIDNSRNFYVNDVLKISFINETLEKFEKNIRLNPNETILSSLKQYSIPKKLIQFFCSKYTIDVDKKIAEISNKSIKTLAENLIAYPFTITGIEGFESCMCTAGGVSIKEINSKTLESKFVQGLYFIGEVLDIDGDSGGYNLQAIWSESALFAEHF